jgi:hypothetical protein
MAGRIHARGKWKRVKIDPNLFVQKEFEDLVCFEELTDYDLVYGDELKVLIYFFFMYCKHSSIIVPMSSSRNYVVFSFLSSAVFFSL